MTQSFRAIDLGNTVHATTVEHFMVHGARLELVLLHFLQVLLFLIHDNLNVRLSVGLMELWGLRDRELKFVLLSATNNQQQAT